MQNLVRNVCKMWQCLKQTTVDITVCCLTVFISLSLIDTLVRQAGMRHPPWHVAGRRMLCVLAVLDGLGIHGEHRL